MRDSEHYLFFSNDINGGVIRLDDGESKHAVSVLRVQAGQRIRVTDGSGAVYECRCTDISKQRVSCEIRGKTIIPKIIPELTLLVGIPDREHFETIIEHATALGVSRIVPLVMEHCRKPWWESWEKQRQRFASKMVVSMKQCLYPYIPLLAYPLSLEEAIAACEKPLLVADQNGKRLCDDDILPYQKLSCLTGPPGGLSANESKLLESIESRAIKLSPARLRTELAAAVLCSRIISAWG